ncbi:MAG: exopolyphosphatase, partial [Pseudomonadales bacterium]
MQELSLPASGPMAALDLGSNSFHLLIAEFKGDRLRVIDRLKDMVRLAEGLGDSGRLRDDVADRALKSLERIGQRLRGLPRENVRIVGTNTLRRVRDGGTFLRAAEAALGFPVEVIAGREEARLIYLGVAHGAPSGGRRHLVVDIGGGSTELIIGTDHQPELLESLFMGCVSASQRFFPPGTAPTAQGMKKARLAARQEMESIEAAYRARGWDDALGASGTILAVQDAQAELLGAPGPITPEGLEALREAVLAGTPLTGVPKQRAAVFPGGLAILSGVFDALGLKRMDTSKSALREGLLWDLA